MDCEHKTLKPPRIIGFKHFSDLSSISQEKGETLEQSLKKIYQYCVAEIYIFLSYRFNHFVAPSDLSWDPLGGPDPQVVNY